MICQSPTVIDNKLGQLRAQFYYLNTNFQGDLKDPLQGYLDTGLVEGINPATYKLHSINLAQNQAYRVDSWYSTSNTTEPNVNGTGTDPLNFYAAANQDSSTFVYMY